MSAKIIKGTEVREEILEEITAEVAQIKEKHGVVPGLVTILVGENPASKVYVKKKRLYSKVERKYCNVEDFLKYWVRRL